MTTNSLLNAFTQIDVTGPNVDLTTLVPNRTSNNNTAGDSKYREALARTLQEPDRTKAGTERRRPPAPKSTESSQSADQKFQNKSSISDSNRAGGNRTTNKPTASQQKPQPKESQLSKPAPSKTGNDTKPSSNATSTNAETIPAGKHSEVKEDDQFFVLQAVAGSPPAEFQPITVTSALVDELTIENGAEITTDIQDNSTNQVQDQLSVANFPSDGLANAHAVIENLIETYEVVSEHRSLPENETPIPPAGLFQALESLSKHEEDLPLDPNINLSEQPDGELSENLTFDPQALTETEIATLSDSVDFEVTPIEANLTVDTIVASEYGITENPEQNDQPQYQFEVTEDVSAKPDSIENNLIGINSGDSVGESTFVQGPEEETTKSDETSQTTVSENGLSTFGEAVVQQDFEGPVETENRQLKSNQTGASATLGEDHTELNALNTTGLADTTIESPQSSFTAETTTTGSIRVSTQNSTEVVAGSISPTEASGKTTSSSQQTAPKPEGNLEKLVNRVADAVRTAGRNGRQLRIRLQPPELGTLQIEVSSRNGVLSARLEVQTTSAQQAILENMTLLKNALAQNGTRLEHIDVQLNDSWHEEAQADFNEQEQQQSTSDNQQEDSDQSSDEKDSESQLQPIGSTTQLDQLDIQV